MKQLRTLYKLYKSQGRFTLITLFGVVGLVVFLAYAVTPTFFKSRGVHPSLYLTDFKQEPDAVSGRIVVKPETTESFNYADYKIVAYVKTDIWYAHPSEGEFALIDEDGSWVLRSVPRIPVPRQMGIFVVEKDYAAPAYIEDPAEELKFIASAYVLVSIASEKTKFKETNSGS